MTKKIKQVELILNNHNTIRSISKVDELIHDFYDDKVNVLEVQSGFGTMCYVQKKDVSYIKVNTEGFDINSILNLIEDFSDEY